MSPQPPESRAACESTSHPGDLALVARSRELLEAGDADAAVQCLQEAFERDPANAQLRSQYGLALGIARRRYHQALDLCQSAVKQEFFNPDLYLNVARLNLAYGFRGEAMRYLRRARMIDPAHPALRALVEEVGARSAPVLSFLPRGHLLNRWLGSARSLLAGRGRGSDSDGSCGADSDQAAA